MKAIQIDERTLSYAVALIAEVDAMIDAPEEKYDVKKMHEMQTTAYAILRGLLVASGDYKYKSRG